MRNIFSTLLTISFVCFFTCSDGDVIDVELDFDGDYSACDGIRGLVLYKTKNNPAESLSVFISSLTIDELLAVGDNDTLVIEKTGTLNYRTYSNENINGADLFCKDVPPSDIIITNDYDSSCNAKFTTVLIEDDNDGVLAAAEDINGDGNLENDDTDGDGLWNYIDEDDDGDNIPTIDEDLDGDGDPTNDDTDGDGKPNYLDDDDDGDGVKTRDEENNTQNQDPTDDITNSDIGPDYLNPDVNTSVAATAYIKHTIQKTFKVELILEDIAIEILSQDELPFGELSNNKTAGTRSVTPEFN